MLYSRPYCIIACVPMWLRGKDLIRLAVRRKTVRACADPPVFRSLRKLKAPCIRPRRREPSIPTTSGLWLRPALRCPEFPRRRRARLEIPTAADKTPVLPLPPAAGGRLIPTSCARRSHNPGNIGVDRSRHRMKKTPILRMGVFFMWLRGKDSNQRPPGYEPDELPAALPRDIFFSLDNIAHAVPNVKPFPKKISLANSASSQADSSRLPPAAERRDDSLRTPFPRRRSPRP